MINLVFSSIVIAVILQTGPVESLDETITTPQAELNVLETERLRMQQRSQHVFQRHRTAQSYLYR